MTDQPMPGEPYVFVSYASRDRERVLPVVAALEAAGVRVWLDREAIAGGSAWSRAIVQGIRNCRAFVLMCSEASMQSHNVMQEIQLAWTYRRDYIPVRLDTTPVSEQAQYFLEGRHWIDLLDQPEAIWRPRLLRALAEAGAAAAAYAGPAFAPAAPTQATTAAPALGPTNLPLPATTFIGRQDEMAEVGRLLGSTRLLTLAGTGGTGKTRLASEAGRALRDRFADGVWLVELAATTDPALLPAAAAQALEIKEEPGRPLADTVVDALRERALLLILDNCEHLVEAAARLAGRILAACSAVRILATSREALAIGGETVYQVPSLAVPAASARPGTATRPETALGYDAVRLFVDRASAAKPGFGLTTENADAVVEICRRLDGIPLAIELAAARVRMLPPEQIAARLGDRFKLLTGGDRTALPRQQTLRALIDWSHDLLTPPERVVFRRLAVFAGGWTLEAAEAVCAGPSDEGEVDAYEVLELLTRLLDKSLVIVAGDVGGEVRYGFLETIREYAAEKLDAAAERLGTVSQHGQWFLALAEEAEPKLIGPEQRIWLERLEGEHDNLRLALASALERVDGETALRITGSLARFWQVHGHLSEARRGLEQALAVGHDAPPARRVKALSASGAFAQLQGDLDVACEASEEALALRRQLGDRHGSAVSLFNLGAISLARGQYEQASAFYEESLGIRRELQDRRGTALALNGLAAVAQARHEHEQAAELLEESVRLTRALADQRNVAMTLRNLGTVKRSLGERQKAAALFDEVLALSRSLGDQPGVAISLNNLGEIARDAGEYARAAEHFTESLTLFRDLGDKESIACSLEGLAGVYAQQGDAEQTLRLLGAAEALREAARAPLSPSEREEHDRTVEAVRALVDEATFDGLWSAGRAQRLDEVIAEVLAERAPA